MPGNAGEMALEPSSTQVWFASTPRGVRRAAVPLRGAVREGWASSPRPAKVSQLPLAASGSCPGIRQAPDCHSTKAGSLCRATGESDSPRSVGDVRGSVRSVVTERVRGEWVFFCCKVFALVP